MAIDDYDMGWVERTVCSWNPETRVVHILRRPCEGICLAHSFSRLSVGHVMEFNMHLTDVTQWHDGVAHCKVAFALLGEAPSKTVMSLWKACRDVEKMRMPTTGFWYYAGGD
jgi:hypothetical protein